MEFRWNDWNEEHIARHGMTPEEAEYLVEHKRRPYPQMIGDGKWIVVGQTSAGVFAQVVFRLDDDRTVYVIHCRPLNDAEKRRFRRRMK
jgi:uncharacterized DUF497 family protein